MGGPPEKDTCANKRTMKKGNRCSLGRSTKGNVKMSQVGQGHKRKAGYSGRMKKG